MLKISKDSWHYRLYEDKYAYHERTNNLCTYVHRVLWALVCLFLSYLAKSILVLVTPVVYVFGFFIGYKPTAVLLINGHPKPYKPVKFFRWYIYPAHIAMPLVTLWIVASVYCSIPDPYTIDRMVVMGFVGVFGSVLVWLFGEIANQVVVEYRTNNELPRLNNEPLTKKLTSNKKLSIIWEYIKARKSKVCPLIEFED